MRNIKSVLVALALLMSGGMVAGQEVGFPDESTLSFEIEKVLNSSGFIVEDGFTVVVFFSLSDDKKVQGLSIASPSVEINELLEKKLRGVRFSGNTWYLGKIYEVAVKKRSMI